MKSRSETDLKLSKWNKDTAFDVKAGATSPPSWPHESLVKLTSSSNYSHLTSYLFEKPNLCVAEVGCFGGNNLRYFRQKGWNCTGFDVTEDAIAVTQENLQSYGIDDIPLLVGTNIRLPVEDQSFDLLVSINTIHYSSGSERLAGLKEMARVLRSGGILIIESAGQNHEMVQKAVRKGYAKWEWQWNDFRNGDLFGFFDDAKDMESELKRVFSEAETGVFYEGFPARPLEFYVGIAQK